VATDVAWQTETHADSIHTGQTLGWVAELGQTMPLSIAGWKARVGAIGHACMGYRIAVLTRWATGDADAAHTVLTWRAVLVLAKRHIDAGAGAHAKKQCQADYHQTKSHFAALYH